MVCASLQLDLVAMGLWKTRDEYSEPTEAQVQGSHEFSVKLAGDSE